MSNNAILIGNLVREWELRYTSSGAAVAKNGLAINESYTNRNGEKVENTTFVDLVAWRQLAENVAESLNQGARVIVSGKIKMNQWETDKGEKRTKHEVEVFDIGPSLKYATCVVTKTERQTFSGQEEATG